ncbi:MAG: MBL fold metallo-hydrolase [Candidatus Thermoplasmatota archaeon]|nr:MBL fold metallo-hydrolase [Candidatus Thermoplasmatota archaeon]
MIDLRVLFPGIARRDGNDWVAYPATIFIQDDTKRIIVDPGSHPRLQEVLEMNSIWTEEIEYVFMTHTHLDHIMNIGLFPDAELIDGSYIYSGSRISKHDGRIPGTGIEILSTPGHTADHSSLLLKMGNMKIAVCGDLFWWEEGIGRHFDYSSLLFLEDPFCIDRDQLISSRRMVLRAADEYIPGHGEVFRLEK